MSLIKINELLSGSTIRINGNVRYDNVRIPARYLLGKENEGFALWEGRRAPWLEQAAASIGTAQAVYEFAKEYAKTRVQGGKPIFQHLNVGSRIVDMRLQIAAARALVYKTAWEYNQQKRALYNPLEFNLCYTFTFEMLRKVAGHAEEIFGGYATLKEMPIERFIRMAHGFAHGFGTPEMNLIASMNLI